jgi:thiol:disulfide interchange protein DsbD
MHAYAALLVALVMTTAALAGTGVAATRQAGAQAEAGIYEGEARVEAQLLVHPDDLGSDRLRMGVLFRLDPGWHLYWRNPGESGLAPELHWAAPGLDVGPVAWPAPRVFLESDAEFTTYGYEGQVLLASEAEVVAGRPDRVGVDVEVLLCRNECVPASFSLQRALDAPPADAASAARIRDHFAEHLSAIPVSPEALGVELVIHPVAATDSRTTPVQIELAPCHSAGECFELGPAPAFFPHVGASLEVPHPENARALRLTLDADRIDGVLALRAPDQTLRYVEVHAPIAGANAADSEGLPSLLWILGLALLGGLVLNAMPCVLPVLAIKVFAVTELARNGRRAAVHHGFAYLAGIETAMLLFAGFVIALQAAGTSVGWGFQLQEPLFVAAVGTVLVLFAMNLFGLFELAAPTGALVSVGQGAAGVRRSFFEGLLAVVLATPCTAPFLGTAVGFAFAATPVVTLAIFLCIGAGLASPFTLVALVPSGSRWIPRSGPWMLTLRTGLGFALLATVVWLVWVFGRSRGLDASAGLLSWLLAVAFATWLYGTLQAASRRWLVLAGGALVAALALTSVGAVRFEAGPAEDVVDAPTLTDSEWRTFTPAAVDETLRSGRRALVVFTADWCITCKVNERFVLTDDAVEAEASLPSLVRFKADWTRRDEQIHAALARFGRAGVPLTVVYHPEAPDRPIVLPELLTTGRLLEALRTTPGAGKG